VEDEQGEEREEGGEGDGVERVYGGGVGSLGLTAPWYDLIVALVVHQELLTSCVLVPEIPISTFMSLPLALHSIIP